MAEATISFLSRERPLTWRVDRQLDIEGDIEGAKDGSAAAGSHQGEEQGTRLGYNLAWAWLSQSRARAG